jgi:putative transposase
MGRLSHQTGSGYTYFVTTKTWQNRSLFSVPEAAQIVTETIIHYRAEGAYLLHAFVVMPDHIHVLLTPGGTVSLEKAIQYIKGGSSHRIHAQRGHKMSIWQPGFHDWTVRDGEDFWTRVSYVHLNPVRARLADRPELWPYSSAGGLFAMDDWPREQGLSSGAEAPKPADG